MRAVVQRVSQASVTGGGKTAEIGRGLLVLLGIEATDTERERDALIAQLFRLKLFPAADSGKPWCAGVRDIENGGVLLVSQFTLNAVLKSGKPSFHRSMPPEPAKEMWSCIVEEAQKLHPEGVRSCVFGSWMDVHLVNDGKLVAIDRIISFLTKVVSNFERFEGPFTICLSATDGKCTTW